MLPSPAGKRSYGVANSSTYQSGHSFTRFIAHFMFELLIVFSRFVFVKNHFRVAKQPNTAVGFASFVCPKYLGSIDNFDSSGGRGEMVEMWLRFRAKYEFEISITALHNCSLTGFSLQGNDLLSNAVDSTLLLLAEAHEPSIIIQHGDHQLITNVVFQFAPVIGWLQILLWMPATGCEQANGNNKHSP